MKTIKTQIKSISLITAILILCQSCKAYYKDSVSLEQAVKSHKRAKVETTTKQTFKFQAISFENDQYYGIKKVKGEIVKMPINQANLSKVRLENKTMSTILTIALPVGILAVGLAIIASTLDFSFGTGNLDFNY